MEDYVYTLLEVDYGDAANGPTIWADDGARHVIAGPWLGTPPDWEHDGQEDDNAAGTAPADEDGVVLLDWLGNPTAELVPGEWATIQVTVNAGSPEGGYLYAWIDYNGDGLWGGSGSETQGEDSYGWNEQIADGLAIAAGETATIDFFVPHEGIDPGAIDARFRLIGETEHAVRTTLDADWTLPVEGIAYSGEVEDYQYGIVALDYGDALLDSTVWASDGARHIITGPWMSQSGTATDAEDDGQPSVGADGDDSNGRADEDGVVAKTYFMPGETATITVYASGEAKLDGWIDYNQNGTLEADEYLFGSGSVTVNGTQDIVFTVPDTARIGYTYARFRISSAGNLQPTGLADDGEVEDYRILISGIDYGDAPDSYGTLRASDGARHVTVGPFFGPLPDHDADGQPTADATGDDNDTDAYPGNDEQGDINLVGRLIPGEIAEFSLNVSGPGGIVDAWMDFNDNGKWDADEHVVHQSVAAGTSSVSFLVPQTAVPGTTFARFRITSDGLGADGQPLTPFGLALSGEVEDHLFTIEEIDYGDAPDSYGTLRASDGARHVIDPAGPYLGALVDHDVDGAPSVLADGDDLRGSDDEDGAVFSQLFWLGNANVDAWYEVLAPRGGYVDVWIDFNGDGVFDQLSEHLPQQSVPASATPFRYNFTVPDQGYTGDAYARVRITSTGKGADGQALTPYGLAADGEVEDHRVFLDTAPVADAGGPYWINTNENLVLDASGSTDVNLAPDAIVRYEWDFQYDPANPLSWNPQFVTTQAIDTIAWPWFDIIGVPQPRPEGPLPIYLRVIDSFGAWSQIATADLLIFDNQPTAALSVTSTVGPGDPAPFAPEEPLHFDGTLSTHDRGEPKFDKQIVKYEWDFNADGAYDLVQNLGDAGFGHAYYAYPKFGQYTAVLRVTDNNVPPKTDVVSVTIDVTDSNLPPVARADGPYWVNVGEGVILNGGNSTNPDNPAWGDQIVTYAWDLDRDGVDDAFGAEVLVSWNQLIGLGLGVAGAYTIELEVTDSLGAKSVDTATLRVFENMPTAVATATPNPAAPGQTIDFDASGSWHDRPDRSIVQYEWDFHYDGSFNPEASSATPSAGFTYDAFGVYNVMLRVTDDNSPAKRDFLDEPLVITVDQGNQAPTADAGGPYVVEAGSGIVLDGSGSSDPNTAFGDQIASYEWSIDGNVLPVNTPTVSLTWAQLVAMGLPVGSELPVTLTVVDKLGASDSDSTTLAIYDNQPVAVFTALPNPVACNVPVAFDASGSYHGQPEAGIATYEWDFDYDGVTFDVDATGAAVSHAYPQFGSYLAALRVTDDSPDEKTDIAVLTIDVSLGNRAPVADAGGPYVFGVSGPIVLDGQGSFDQDELDGYGDSIVSYLWDLDGDGQFDDASGAAPTIPAEAFSFPLDTPVTIALRVEDQFGAFSTDATTLMITMNQPPLADAGGPYTADEGSPITLDGTGSTDDQPGLIYEWDLDYDGVTFQVDASGAQPLVTFADDGVRTIALRVTDQTGIKDLATTTVTIANLDPVAGDLQVSPSITLDGQVLIGAGTVVVAGSFSDPGALDTHEVSIAWGDGQVSAAAVNQEAGTFEATHVYAGGGRFTIQATITDDDGGAALVSRTVNIVNDLGTVDFRDDLVNQDPAAGDLWYRLDAAHDGLLTVELGGSGAAAAAVDLFDASQAAVAALADGPSTGGADFLVTAGASYYLKLSGGAADVDLRLTNLVEQAGAALTVHGTDADDLFEFELAEGHYVRINGTEYLFAAVAGAVDTVDFDGGLGNDTATFYGDAADQSARFFTGRGEFYSGVLEFDKTGFFVNALAENLVAHSGGGEDYIQMYDSPGDDVFTVAPRLATLTGPGYSHAGYGFYVSLGYATSTGGADGAGGRDVAEMQDSTGIDKVKVGDAVGRETTKDTVRVSNWSATDQPYFLRTKGFEEITVLSNGGGDLARIFDSAADDTVNASYDEVTIVTGSNLEKPGIARKKATIRGFESTIAYSVWGGSDTLNLFDSPGDDKVVLRAHKAEMSPRQADTPIFTGRAFSLVHAIASAGAEKYDYVRMHDTVLVDLLVAGYLDGETWASLSKPADGSAMTQMYDALGFDVVRAVNDYGDSPRNKKDVDATVDFLMLDGGWDEI